MRILTILILSILVSCKEVNKIQQSNNLIKQDSVILLKSESPKKKLIKETDTLFKKIFNKALIGLSIKDKNENQKKYWIDFNSNCMCDSPSLFLKTIDNKLFLYNYCSNSIPPDSEEPFFEYEIKKILYNKKDLEILAENNHFQSIIFKFKKVDKNVYKLTISGKLPTDYIGVRINQYFTPTPDNFQKEDCGDFDG
ncbi:hypothetical protein [Lacinutrix salivirga]